jgi:hypothetical protein
MLLFGATIPPNTLKPVWEKEVFVVFFQHENAGFEIGLQGFRQ